MKKAMIYGLGISGTGAKELLEKEGYETIVVDDIRRSIKSFRWSRVFY